MLGSILLASNETTAAAATAAAASTAVASSAYNQLMTKSATTALNAWMTSNTSAAVLSNGSYAGLTVPTNFTYTLLNVSNVAVINVTVSNSTVESLLGITSSSQHWALNIWLNITVQVGYSVALNSSVNSVAGGRRLLDYVDSWIDQPATDSTALALPSSSADTELALHNALLRQAHKQNVDLQQLQLSALPHAAMTASSQSDAISHGQQLPRPAASAGAGLVSGSQRRQLQQYLSYTWTSPLDLQMALLRTAFTQTSQCNATAVALQLGGSTGSLTCPASTSTTLLTDLLASASAGSKPALTVLMLSTSPKSSRSTSNVDSNSGVEASVQSGISMVLQGYERQIAELLGMIVTAINTVDELGASQALKYIQAFITSAENYISVTTGFVNQALAIFGKAVAANSAVASVSAYTQLVQTALRDAAAAENALLASTTFQAAVKALAPNCTTRDSLGDAQITFLLAANQSQESFAYSSDTAEAVVPDAVLNETASNCPPELVDRETGYCVSSWSGYPVVQVSSKPAGRATGEQVTGRRRMVGFDGNVVIGGLLVHQVRHPFQP